MAYKTIFDRYEETKDLSKSMKNSVRARQKRIQKLKNRIKYILDLSEYVYFLTFTLDNEHLNYKKDSIKKLMRITMKSIDPYYYVGNEDYGKTNNRLHYHFVIGTKEKISYKDLQTIYTYGNLDIKKVNNRKAQNLALYIQKLTNHAKKENTGKLIYMRKTY